MNVATFVFKTYSNNGIIGKVSGLFSKRNLNILSFKASKTDLPEFFEIVVVAEGTETYFKQIEVQALRIEDICSSNISFE